MQAAGPSVHTGEFASLANVKAKKFQPRQLTDVCFRETSSDDRGMSEITRVLYRKQEMCVGVSPIHVFWQFSQNKYFT